MNTKKAEISFEDLEVGQLRQIVTLLGGPVGAIKLLKGDLTVSKQKRPWLEKDGVIYFYVISNGMKGKEWIKYLERRGHMIGSQAKSMLIHPGFKPTNGIKTKIAVLRGSMFKDDERIGKNILAEISRRKLLMPNPEVACLIRDTFSDEDILATGLCGMVVMHNPLFDLAKKSGLLGVYHDANGSGLSAHGDKLDMWWQSSYGFAAAVSQEKVR